MLHRREAKHLPDLLVIKRLLRDQRVGKRIKLVTMRREDIPRIIHALVKDLPDLLVEAFEGLSQRHSGDKKTRRRYTYQFAFPKTVVPPREGYDAPSKVVSLKDAVGEISAETVMAYPPGIPLVIPGELVDRDVVRMIEFYYRENGQVLKDSEPRKMKVIDRSRWDLAQEYPFL